MVYLSSHEHDVFVSYAHYDDDDRWVTDFKHYLEKKLNGQLAILEGRNEIRTTVWQDNHNLRQQGELDARLKQALERSAFLLVVLSDHWARSEICQSELEIFKAAVGEEFVSRIFIVLHSQLQRGWPDVLTDARGHALLHRKFLRDVDGSLRTIPIKSEQGSLTSKAGEVLQETVKDLADAMYEHRHRSPAAGSARPSIFLAACPEGTAARLRERLAGRLAADYVLVPRNPPQRIREFLDFEADFATVLGTADLFVQILDSHAGRPLTEHPEGLACLQAAKAQALGKPCLHWIEPETASALAVQNNSLDPDHAAFLRSLRPVEDGGTLVRGDLDALEQAVRARMTAVDAKPPTTGRKTCWIAYHRTVGTTETQARTLAAMVAGTPSALTLLNVPVPKDPKPSALVDIQNTCQGAIILWGQLGLDKIRPTIDSWISRDGVTLSIAYCDPEKEIRVGDFVQIPYYSASNAAETSGGVQAYVRQLEAEILGG
ncbi:toll/interleukin-1 receptor domain-containing protein [Thalassobaculum sp.]|uniref:toll/interleukin-1 receptor domain-containing protein n=1 Tax=Thalassobaculum sp. TaxID=2022740 RepID=UPI0032EE68A1